jgi:predicted kinase
MNPSLTLIRGLPGSGKSTLSKCMYVYHPIGAYDQQSVYYEADQYFMKNGKYEFDIDKLYTAHRWCYEATSESLKSGHNVTVSNTFTTIKELKPYFELAKQFCIVPNVILCQGNFGSIHSVPTETMIKMKSRFVFDISSLYEQYVV